MNTIHIYNLKKRLYASAAEVVPAVLRKEPVKIISHGLHSTNDVHGAILRALKRAIASLQYGLVQNTHAGLYALAVLLLLFWPVIYNEIPIPEITLAARIAAGACVALSFLSATGAGIQIRRLLNHANVLNSAEIEHRADKLLPSATAWGQDKRSIVFPWIGLGLVLFSIVLNCVVVGSYAHPAILSNGIVHRNIALTSPWTEWVEGARYLEREFVVPFGAKGSDPQQVLRVSYRVRNLNTDSPVPGPEELEYRMLSEAWNLVQRVTDMVRQESPPGLSSTEIARETSLALASHDALEALTMWLNEEVFSQFPGLKLEHVKLSVEAMSISEFISVWQKQLADWSLR